MKPELLCALYSTVLFLLQLLLFALCAAGAAAVNNDDANMNSSAILPLIAGLEFRMSTAFDSKTGYPLFLDAMFSVATPTLDEGGLFLPILSSPSFFNISSTDNISSPPSSVNYTFSSFNRSTPNFNVSPSSDPSYMPFGFSLGFYLIPSQLYSDTHRPCLYGCSLFLAVCAGSMGNTTDIDSTWSVSLDGALTKGTISYRPNKTMDGFAAPVWVANKDSPIQYADKASLLVKQVADSNGGSNQLLELQLLDGKKVVWQLHDVNKMEMQDDGYLLVYNRSSDEKWRSSLADTLVEGQSLTVGQELVSNDSSYVARMEKGGLVFYMNKAHFNREEQVRPPYWLFPVLRDGSQSTSSDINQMILTAPCSNSPAFAEVMRPNYKGYGIEVHAGLCSSGGTSVVIPDFLNREKAKEVSWIFWRLENDGMLYSYTVFLPPGSAASATRKPVDMRTSWVSQPLFLRWQECNVPMACGPLGVCRPGAKPFCQCPDSEVFEPVNKSDIFQGCRRTTDLPDCASSNEEHVGSTEFFRLNSTASILLFNEWTFNSKPGADVDACKQSCLSDCSCNGFFYQVNISFCLYITDEITMLAVGDSPFPDVTSQLVSGAVSGRDYVTFLKVKSRGNSEQLLNIEKKHKTFSSTRLTALTASVISVCVLLGIAGFIFWARRKKLTHNQNMLATESVEFQDILPLLLTRFAYKDLSEATKGFGELLGAGACGSVYAGVLPDGRKVAVKVLKTSVQETRQSKQFLAEIAAIGRTSHHNIVRLVGFCWEFPQRLLVYEYVEGGSLDHWIFVREPAPSNDNTPATSAAPFLDWKTRYSVALGIARGLSYLHEECQPPILHFDIKPQNILLDNKFVAKLSDFGMSRLIDKDMSAVMTGMRGTPGYIAPEWCSQARASKKSDVYSMGMVFLEIVGGRRNLDFALLNSSVDAKEQEAWHFPTWAARKCEQGPLMEVVDNRLRDGSCGFDEEEARRLIYSAFWCIQDDPTLRPNAPTVVQWLGGNSPVEQPPYSSLIGRREPLVVDDSSFMQ